ITSAACGYGFTLLSSKTKDVTKVWGMGLNKDSQLGFHRSRKDKSKQVVCGQDHSLFLTNKGEVYSCGWGADGQTEEGHVFVWGYGILGKGPNLLETALPEMIPPTLFGLTEFNPHIQVSQIRCGLSHFAALTNNGELFVWGKNIRGCLGIGRLEDQYFPWRVTMPGEPVDVACGVDHMVTLAKSFI
ncbi:putative Williams-Beuren syndrome chromosomal region 16 protein like protein, partial [Cricetulus griseus]